jgi:hypothetical protein
MTLPTRCIRRIQGRTDRIQCSGQNPCQRCIDNSKRCFFSEDQTAAEALQNLSRPAATQASNASGHGNGLPRQRAISRDNDTERRASDASVPGMTMEARMARMEAMMEALMRDRGLNMTPMGSIEREDSGSDVFRGDPAFPMPPLDPINPALAFMEQSSLFSQDAPNPTRSPVPVSGAPFGSAPPHLIHMGSRTMPFPGPAEYQQYLLSFFTDIHLSHPCIDEAKFRRRSERVLTNNVIQLEENQFLALNYAIFACCDVLLNVTPADTNTPAGWRWSEIVDDLLDKKSLLSGSGDLTLIQCVLFQVRLMFSMIPRTSPFQSRH